jgi:Cupin
LSALYILFTIPSNDVAPITSPAFCCAHNLCRPHAASPDLSRIEPDHSKDLINQLELAGTSVGRFTIIKAQGPAYYKYDFNPDANSKTTDGGTFIGEGGQGVLANRAKFPALLGLGIAFSMGFMNPCGMNTPHVYPRATEVLTIANVAEGGVVKTGFILENGIASQFKHGTLHVSRHCLPTRERPLRIQ